MAETVIPLVPPDERRVDTDDPRGRPPSLIRPGASRWSWWDPGAEERARCLLDRRREHPPRGDDAA
ncbi:MAG: hypothetical protein U5R31_07985 [Acidimicrobiia bacterium]|nr:hypothetical protein [Acidimicrobiia bacterium]